jgi:hypothetical protein
MEVAVHYPHVLNDQMWGGADLARGYHHTPNHLGGLRFLARIAQ